MHFANWGNFPTVDTLSYNQLSIAELASFIRDNHGFIARGNGRSYGDASLNQHSILNLSKVKFNKHGMVYNSADRELIINSGCALTDVLNNYFPEHVIFPVLPGTKKISIGGAIAADIHGKDHHINGTLSKHISCIDLMTASGEMITVTPEKNRDLFWATCGGQGLTGLIISATIKMLKTESSVLRQRVTVCESLDKLIAATLEQNNSQYCASWIDLSATRTHGRGIVFSGRFASSAEVMEQGNQFLEKKYCNSRLSVPCYCTSKLFNQTTVKAFNSLYYYLNKRKNNPFASINGFFFPLDAVNNWNRLYGHKGFVQYQFVVPQKEVLQKIVNVIKKEKLYSTLGVLKIFGKQPKHYGNISFPMEGYSLAMDFKLSHGLFKNLDYLDEIVADAGGHVYLAKDSRMKASTFRRMYGKAVDEFLEVKAKYDPNGKFCSLLSKRLKLNVV
ncbi:FAD/FMN-containing dehydrogenase [Succinivibrio dextrinosolvens]|uniref:FAD-binding oxidoreductase n=1 Tax=Succinivibrio dextrinosolvens TaxID=83771 RepID=UPI0008E9043F|nr:FAD-binding oxidoreductase [Succinivibrio dextrinosolvens]SFS31326.1 FAD/FMN-containing dehydrogenase [Succinivibrio dextrinosolvens]